MPRKPRAKPSSLILGNQAAITSSSDTTSDNNSFGHVFEQFFHQPAGTVAAPIQQKKPSAKVIAKRVIEQEPSSKNPNHEEKVNDVDVVGVVPSTHDEEVTRNTLLLPFPVAKNPINASNNNIHNDHDDSKQNNDDTTLRQQQQDQIAQQNHHRFSFTHPVASWLSNFGCGGYFANFINRGFDVLHACALIKEEDLDMLGVLPVGHRRLMLDAVTKLKKFLNVLEAHQQQQLLATATATTSSSLMLTKNGTNNNNNNNNKKGSGRGGKNMNAKSFLVDTPSSSNHQQQQVADFFPQNIRNGEFQAVVMMPVFNLEDAVRMIQLQKTQQQQQQNPEAKDLNNNEQEEEEVGDVLLKSPGSDDDSNNEESEVHHHQNHNNKSKIISKAEAYSKGMKFMENNNNNKHNDDSALMLETMSKNNLNEKLKRIFDSYNAEVVQAKNELQLKCDSAAKDIERWLKLRQVKLAQQTKDIVGRHVPEFQKEFEDFRRNCRERKQRILALQRQEEESYSHHQQESQQHQQVMIRQSSVASTSSSVFFGGLGVGKGTEFMSSVILGKNMMMNHNKNSSLSSAAISGGGGGASSTSPTTLAFASTSQQQQHQEKNSLLSHLVNIVGAENSSWGNLLSSIMFAEQQQQQQPLTTNRRKLVKIRVEIFDESEENIEGEERKTRENLHIKMNSKMNKSQQEQQQQQPAGQIVPSNQQQQLKDDDDGEFLVNHTQLTLTDPSLSPSVGHHHQKQKSMSLPSQKQSTMVTMKPDETNNSKKNDDAAEHYCQVELLSSSSSSNRSSEEQQKQKFDSLQDTGSANNSLSSSKFILNFPAPNNNNHLLQTRENHDEDDEKFLPPLDVARDAKNDEFINKIPERRLSFFSASSSQQNDASLVVDVVEENHHHDEDCPPPEINLTQEQLQLEENNNEIAGQQDDDDDESQEEEILLVDDDDDARSPSKLTLSNRERDDDLRKKNEDEYSSSSSDSDNEDESDDDDSSIGLSDLESSTCSENSSCDESNSPDNALDEEDDPNPKRLKPTFLTPTDDDDVKIVKDDIAENDDDFPLQNLSQKSEGHISLISENDDDDEDFDDFDDDDDEDNLMTPSQQQKFNENTNQDDDGECLQEDRAADVVVASDNKSTISSTKSSKKSVMSRKSEMVVDLCDQLLGTVRKSESSAKNRSHQQKLGFQNYNDNDDDAANDNQKDINNDSSNILLLLDAISPVRISSRSNSEKNLQRQQQQPYKLSSRSSSVFLIEQAPTEQFDAILQIHHHPHNAFSSSSTAAATSVKRDNINSHHNNTTTSSASPKRSFNLIVVANADPDDNVQVSSSTSSQVKNSNNNFDHYYDFQNIEDSDALMMNKRAEEQEAMMLMNNDDDDDFMMNSFGLDALVNSSSFLNCTMSTSKPKMMEADKNTNEGIIDLDVSFSQLSPINSKKESGKIRQRQDDVDVAAHDDDEEIITNKQENSASDDSLKNISSSSAISAITNASTTISSLFKRTSTGAMMLHQQQGGGGATTTATSSTLQTPFNRNNNNNNNLDVTVGNQIATTFKQSHLDKMNLIQLVLVARRLGLTNPLSLPLHLKRYNSSDLFPNSELVLKLESFSVLQFNQLQQQQQESNVNHAHDNKIFTSTVTDSITRALQKLNLNSIQEKLLCGLVKDKISTILVRRKFQQITSKIEDEIQEYGGFESETVLTIKIVLAAYRAADPASKAVMIKHNGLRDEHEAEELFQRAREIMKRLIKIHTELLTMSRRRDQQQQEHHHHPSSMAKNVLKNEIKDLKTRRQTLRGEAKAHLKIIFELLSERDKAAVRVRINQIQEAQKARFVVQSNAKSTFITYDKENDQYFLTLGTGAAMKVQQQVGTHNNNGNSYSNIGIASGGGHHHHQLERAGNCWTPFERWLLRDEPNLDQIVDIVSDIYNLSRPSLALHHQNHNQVWISERLSGGEVKNKKKTKHKNKKKEKKKKVKKTKPIENDPFAGILDGHDDDDNDSSSSSSDSSTSSEKENMKNNNNDDASMFLMQNLSTSSRSLKYELQRQQLIASATSKGHHISRNLASKSFLKTMLDSSAIHYVGTTKHHHNHNHHQNGSDRNNNNRNGQQHGKSNFAMMFENNNNNNNNLTPLRQDGDDDGSKRNHQGKKNAAKLLLMNDSPHGAQRHVDKPVLSQDQRQKANESFRQMNRFNFGH